MASTAQIPVFTDTNLDTHVSITVPLDITAAHFKTGERAPPFYGAVLWDPWLIVTQVVALQCLYYLTLGLFFSMLVEIRVSRMSLVYFFDYATLTASSTTGWCAIISFLLSSLAGSVYMRYLVERAKKFSATLYIIHIFICIVYGGWPASITWWVVNGTGITVMALLGEYLCIKLELPEIPIPLYRSITQIVALQCLYYLTHGLFFSMLDGISRMSLVYFFDYATLTASSITGWRVIISFLLNSLVGSVYMLYLVERAKKCLDFSATLYIIHIFICIVYGGWPASVTWWVVNGTGFSLMTLLGEYQCIRRELREIPITRYRSSV